MAAASPVAPPGAPLAPGNISRSSRYSGWRASACDLPRFQVSAGLLSRCPSRLRRVPRLVRQQQLGRLVDDRLGLAGAHFEEPVVAFEKIGRESCRESV